MTYEKRWALVTGASAGIGKAFAKALASRGANVVLVARRKDKLDEIAADLEQKHGVQIKSVVCDLAQQAAPQHLYDQLTQEGSGVTVDILINNAGFGLPGIYTANEWAAYEDYLQLMVTSYAHLTRLFLPGMLMRGYGRIIQVSSVAGLVPAGAGHTLYGPSKAFLVSFAQALAAECDGTGVNSTALCPGFTYSEFHDVNGTRDLVSKLPKYTFMEAEPVVEGTLEAVERRHVVYVPGAWNKFIVWLAKALPRPWAAELVKRQSAGFRKQTSE